MRNIIMKIMKKSLLVLFLCALLFPWTYAQEECTTAVNADGFEGNPAVMNMPPETENK